MEHKRISLGRVNYGDQVGCEGMVEWKLTDDGVFTAAGELKESRRSGHIIAGQCLDTLVELFPDHALLHRIHPVWKRWHLNDMRAGCEHQYTAGWDKRPIYTDQPLNAYVNHPYGTPGWNMLGWLEYPTMLADGRLGLLKAPCPECGYKYGTKWLKEELPPEVVAEIKSWKDQ